MLTGCAHPGLERILAAAAEFGQLYGIAGGFRGFHNFDLLKVLWLICPCHCSRYKQEIRDLFGDRTLQCGVGSIIEL
jgi:7,8-dihydropterin-6-yl-methyl-4-(beta-D-ribofuranosyl)aminobenzene 5'-phosphate synthase